MAVRFVLGRAGSGKTHHCLRSITAELEKGPEGPPLIFLVPEQATFQMERALLARTGGRAFTRARVLSFRRLAHWVFSEAGGPAQPPIGDVQRRLLLRLLLRRRIHDLEVFGRAADQPGFEEELARLLAEFLRQRVTPDQLRAVALGLEERSPTASSPQSYLCAKLRDLAMLLADYAAEIEGRFVNPEEAPEFLAQALARSPLLAGAQLWVDGFASFGAQELFALAEILAQVENADICLCLDPREVGPGAGNEAGPANRKHPGGETSSAGTKDFRLFAETIRTYRRVEELARSKGLNVSDPLILETAESAPRFASAPELGRLEHEYGNPRPDPWSGSVNSLHLVEAASHRSQAEAAARELLRLRRERGLRWREMAVLSRNLDGDLSELIPAFREHGIPRFVDRRRTLDSHPLVSTLLAAVRVICHGWHSPDVIEFLKAGLTPMQPLAIDRLENYVLEHGISGRALWTTDSDWTAWPRRRLDEEEPWEQGEVDEERRLKLERINQDRRQVLQILGTWQRAHFNPSGDRQPRTSGLGVSPKISSSPSSSSSAAESPATGRSLANALADLLHRLEAAPHLETLERDARTQGDWGHAEEHRQALDTVLDALSDLASILDSEPLTNAEMIEVAEATLEGLQIGVIPAGLDEVLLGSVDRSRQPELKACLVIGLAEGEFPSAHAQDPLLTDPEREALRNHGCEVAPPASDQFLNESYFAYIAYTRASEWLWVCRPMADERGDELAASPFWKQVCRIFPDVPVEEVRGPDDKWDRVATPRQWLALFSRRETDTIPDDAPLRARLLEVLAPLLKGRDLTGFTSSLPIDFSPMGAGWTDPEELLRRSYPSILQGPVATSEAALDPSLAAAALVRRSMVSVSLSQVESFTRCPFKHFASYLLHLEERPEYRIELVDLGSLYHAVLNLWVGNAIRDKVDLTRATEEDIQRAIRGLTDLVAPRLKNELLLSNARFRYILEMVKETLIHLARTIVASLQKGMFRPYGVEASFGGSRRELRPLEFDLSEGRRLQFRGRIDRVDTSPTGDEDAVGVCVIDYKMSERKLDLAKVFYGLDLQLGGYLLALAESPDATRYFHGRPVAVGAFYMPVREQAVSYLHPEDMADESEESHYRRREKRGLFDADWLDRLEPVQAGEKGIFHHVARKKNGEVSFSTSDCLARDDLDAVLRHVSTVLRQSGEAVLTGRIEAAPAKYGNEIPCDFCPFAPVCRVDALMTPFRNLPKLGRRENALYAMRETDDHGD